VLRAGSDEAGSAVTQWPEIILHLATSQIRRRLLRNIPKAERHCEILMQ
jgi:hypothetical protein